MEPAAHKTLHIVIILLATLLSLLSILAYLRIGNRRFLLICLAFLLFAVREFIIFSEVVFSYRYDLLIPLMNAPVSHVLSLLILILFFLGVLWGQLR